MEAAETFRDRVVSVDCEAVDTFCRFRGGAIVVWRCFGSGHNMVARPPTTQMHAYVRHYVSPAGKSVVEL